MSESAAEELKLIRRREVEALTSLSCTAIYRLMEEKKFPRPVRVGSMRVAWVKGEVLAWVRNRIEFQRVAYDGRCAMPPVEAAS